MRLLMLLICLPLCGQIACTVAPLDGLKWAAECVGPPGTTLSRARILSHVPVGFLLRDQAAALLQREARDSRQSRLSSAGNVLLPMCAAGAGLAVAKVHGAAAYATGGVALVCGLWAVLHQRVQADRPDPAADIAALMPAVVRLDESGGWSGLLVAARPGGAAVTVEVK